MCSRRLVGAVDIALRATDAPAHTMGGRGRPVSGHTPTTSRMARSCSLGGVAVLTPPGGWSARYLLVTVYLAVVSVTRALPTVADCGALPTVQNADLTIKTNSTQSSPTVLQVTCHQNYRLTGSDVITCSISGQWNKNSVSCEAVTCASLPTIPNGEVNLSGNVVGSTATYVCLKGFVMGGAAVRVCQQTSTWSRQQPQCKRILCKHNGSPVNGQASPPDLTDYPAGTTISYSCNHGYTINGSYTAVCSDQGAWTFPVPKCLRITCGLPPALPHAHPLSTTDVMLDAIVKYVCDVGYESVVNTTLKCAINASWSGPKFTCTQLPPSITTEATTTSFDYVISTVQMTSASVEDEFISTSSEVTSEIIRASSSTESSATSGTTTAMPAPVTSVMAASNSTSATTSAITSAIITSAIVTSATTSDTTPAITSAPTTSATITSATTTSATTTSATTTSATTTSDTTTSATTTSATTTSATTTSATTTSATTTSATTSTTTPATTTSASATTTPATSAYNEPSIMTSGNTISGSTTSSTTLSGMTVTMTPTTITPPDTTTSASTTLQTVEERTAGEIITTATSLKSTQNSSHIQSTRQSTTETTTTIMAESTPTTSQLSPTTSQMPTTATSTGTPEELTSGPVLPDYSTVGPSQATASTTVEMVRAMPPEKMWIVIGVVIGALLPVVLVVCMCYLCHRQRNSGAYALRYRNSPREDSTIMVESSKPEIHMNGHVVSNGHDNHVTIWCDEMDTYGKKHRKSSESSGGKRVGCTHSAGVTSHPKSSPTTQAQGTSIQMKCTNGLTGCDKNSRQLADMCTQRTAL